MASNTDTIDRRAKTAGRRELELRPPQRPLLTRVLESRVGQWVIAGSLPLLVLVIWEFAGGESRGLFGNILPTPSRVWEAWYVWAFGPAGLGLNPYSGTWWSNVWFSAERVLQGFALAIVIGVPLGVIVGWSRLAATVFDPTIQWLRPIPITAWLPFSIAVFGIANFGAIFLIALGAFFPIFINTTQGARDVDRNWIRAAQMMGASQWDTLVRVVLPAALPSIFTGLRIGLGIAWTAVIVAEMVAVKSGLGYVLWDAYYVGRMDVVIADMVSIGMLGFISDRAIQMLSDWVLGWRRMQSFNN